MVLPASHGIPRAPRYSGSLKGRHISFAYRTITCFGPTFQKSSTKNMLCNFPAARYCSHSMPHYPSLPTRTGLKQSRFGLLPFRSPLLRQSIILSFPGGTKMVQFPPLPSLTYEFSQGYPDKRDGLSHSEISGLTCVCHYPKLIAACHVLLRQPMPRHPPCTLIILIHFSYIFRRNFIQCASSTEYVKELFIYHF